MLRKHNKRIPVKVFLLSNEFVPKYNFTKDFLKFCEVNQIQIITRKIDHGYFLSNKHHIKECDEDQILFIDSDTFIFGDVDEIFEKYKKFNFVGCKNKWVQGKGWNFLNGFLPFNGGVQLYNNSSHKEILRKMPESCDRLGDDLKKWLDEGGMSWNREEMAISKIVIEDKYSFEYFKKEDCMIPLFENDLKDIKKTIIFHSFTSLWERVYKKVTI
jgi:hypothetical protein